MLIQQLTTDSVSSDLDRCRKDGELVSLDKGLGYEVDKRSTVDEIKGRRKDLAFFQSFDPECWECKTENR